MICIHCRLELLAEAQSQVHEKVWVDLIHGDSTCPPPAVIPPGALLAVTSHSPAYEISEALLDDIVDALGELVEVLDRIGDDERTEQYAQLAEIVSTEPKLVTP